MKEIWELAISAQVLPFTLLLVPIGLYWMLAAIGTLDLEFLDVDFDAHHEADVHVEVDGGGDAVGDHGHGHGSVDPGHGPFLGFLHGALKAVNATDVPVMVVFSILFIMMWVCAMLGNLWFNSDGGDLRGTIVGFSALVAGLVLTRLATEPLKPVFRAMKGSGTENRPVVGRSGKVRSHELTDHGGQVEIEEKGEVLLLNAKLAEGADPVKRGAEVIVYGYDQDSGIYYVKNLSPS